MTPFILIVALLGLIIGSFLNVVIARLGTKEGIVWSRSHCPHCQHTLGFWDLIPLLSFLALRGRCRYCHAPISWQYPLVELTTAILFVLVFVVRYGSLSDLRPPTPDLSALSLELLALSLELGFVAILIVISFYDARTLLIPDSLVGVAVVSAIVSVLVRGGLSALTSGLLATVIFAGFFALLFFVSRGKWLGGGDVKLAVPIAIIVGWPTIFVTFLVSFWSGAVLGILILFYRKYSIFLTSVGNLDKLPLLSFLRKQESRGNVTPSRSTWIPVASGDRNDNRSAVSHEIPFGPFLALGAVVSMLWGGALLHWYVTIFGI
ncbi:MAG: prepilin peptidase [Parcubacteria group bacterium]|nr:prepilin peptidase [Parcubacteria group bacterium]